jgi:hypothetical protein
MFPPPTAWLRVLALAALLLSTAPGFAADEPASATDPKSAADPAVPKSALFADLDNDGAIDILVSNLYQTGPRQPQPFGEYWIGIDGVSPDDALRAQLELPAGQGVLVNQVVEESPAAKAGLKQYDVLLACHDQPLAEIADLAKIIAEKKETLLTLRLIRGGKRILIEITPEKRPASQTGETCPAVSKVDDATFVRRVWLDLLGALPEAGEVQKFVGENDANKRVSLVNRLLRKSTVARKSCTACHANDGEGWKLYRNIVPRDTEVVKLGNGDYSSYVKRLVGLPGAFVNISGTITQKLPDDVSITVTINGNEPAKIAVKKGDQTWEGAAVDVLTKIPVEVRGYIDALFAPAPAPSGARLFWKTYDPHGRWDLLLKGRVDMSDDAWPDVFIGRPTNVNVERPASESAFERVDKQIESLGTQLAELRKTMHDLQQSLKTEKKGKSGAGER